MPKKQQGQGKSGYSARRERTAAEKAARMALYRSCPQRDYSELTGRSPSGLREIASKYSIPCGGAPIDIGACLRALHDFVAATGPAMRRAEREAADGDPMLSGGASPALERYRNHKADILALDLAERRGESIPIADLEAGIAAWQDRMKRFGDWLRKRHGNEAGEAFNEALEDSARMCERLLDTA
jgi:hypothetical protein